MKNLILPFFLILAIMACKKKDNNSSSNGSSNGTGGPTNDTYSVRIESNYKRSTMAVSNMTDMIDIKGYNNSVNDPIQNTPITYTFTGVSNKKYRVYTTSVKNGGDTTLYMTDAGLTWNYLQVKKNGTVIYDHKDTVGYGTGYGSNRITSNECKINY